MTAKQWAVLEGKAYHVFGGTERIVKTQLVILNWGDLFLRVHMMALGYFRRALIYTQTAGYEIHRMEAFCWRMQRGSLTRRSLHSWAIAMDINSDTNPMQKVGDKLRTDMNPLFVKGWKEAGFAWGGDFKRPDPMHFELRPEFWGLSVPPLGTGEKPKDAAGGPN